MKILYIDPVSTPTARENVLGIFNAYKKRGEVRLFDYRARIPRKGRRRPAAIRAMNSHLLKTAVAFKPHLIHVGKGELVRASVIQQIKRKTKAFVFHAFGDWRPQPQPYVWQIGRVADITGFSNMHPGLNQKYRKLGVSRIEFWCAGFNPQVYRPVEAKFRFDTVFMANVGRMTPGRVALQGPREKFVFALAKAGINVHLFGKGNKRQAVRHPRLHSHDYVAGIKFAKACSEAKIALGCGVHNVRNYTSWPRLINSMASGTLYITRYFLGLENFFKNKQHLVWFRSIPEAVKLVKYYLGHDAERKAIARAGYERVTKHHTWDARVNQVIKWAGLA